MFLSLALAVLLCEIYGIRELLFFTRSVGLEDCQWTFTNSFQKASRNLTEKLCRQVLWISSSYTVVNCKNIKHVPPFYLYSNVNKKHLQNQNHANNSLLEKCILYYLKWLENHWMHLTIDDSNPMKWLTSYNNWFNKMSKHLESILESASKW